MFLWSVCDRRKSCSPETSHNSKHLSEPHLRDRWERVQKRRWRAEVTVGETHKTATLFVSLSSLKKPPLVNLEHMTPPQGPLAALAHPSGPETLWKHWMMGYTKPPKPGMADDAYSCLRSILTATLARTPFPAAPLPLARALWPPEQLISGTGEYPEPARSFHSWECKGKLITWV